nr:transcription elongation factor spt5 [Quercus suber]
MATINDINLVDDGEEDEDDFNPSAQIDSDAEGEKSEVDADDEPQRRRGNTELQDDDDDDAPKADNGADELNGDAEGDEEEPEAADEDEEDEEDEDEEDEDIDGQPSRKRRRRHARNQFIDVEAEVDEEDEEEPEEDEDLPGDEMHPDDLQEMPEGADRDDRKHRELDRQREQQFQMDVEQEAARLKDKYGRADRPGGGGGSIVPQHLLLPGPEDPRIWRMKCRPGKEREIINTLYNLIHERANSREPIVIISAFERGATAMAGNIYVEARRQDDVTNALDGIQNVFMGTKPFMIPREEMVDLLKTTKTQEIERGMYVRMKRGVYAGDLAMVDDVEANGTEIIVKLVPRLDYGLNEDANAAAPVLEENGQKRKRPIKSNAPRPPPRLFSENEAKKRHGRYLTKQSGLSNAWTYNGKEYLDGFLIETTKINNVQTENVNPKLEEVTMFASGGEDGAENLDLAALAATLKTNTAGEFLPGDHVEMFRGEQKGISGEAVQVYGDVVKVKVSPGQGALSGQTIEAPIRDLRKLFREGDHVKVIGGSKYTDEVGMVVRTKDDRVTILTDSNQQEITVFSKDLREATDSGGAAGDSKYHLFDLVQLDAATVGCVTKVDRESLRVLDQSGTVRSLLPSNISNRIERRKNAVATDRDGNEMKVDDTIKEVSGELRTGRVLHLHRNFVFVQNREKSENAGVWIARHANVITTAAKAGGRASGLDLTKMNPAMQIKTGGPMAPPQAKGRDRLIGKTVKITRGPSKGLIGIVKDATNDQAKVELHAKNKIIPIEKAKLAMIDPKTGAVIQGGIQNLQMGRPPPAAPGRTPAYGQTPGRPSYGGPPSGARTPAYAMGGGGRTPAWKQDAGARTPAYGGGTSYGGSGGFGGQTSYGNGGGTSYGGATSYGGGSKTPAYASSLEAPTPGYSSAPTPGAYDQPTPGAFRDQTSPGSFRDQQYRTLGVYSTPGGLPETPGAYSAETPGAGADDGPRYD